MAVGIHRVDDPQLITRAAGRYVVDALPLVRATQGQRLALRRGIDDREEDDVALVPLKLGGVAAQDPAASILGRAHAPSQDRVDLERLLRANHADRADRAAFELFEPADGRDQRGHFEGFRIVRLVLRDRALDPVRDQVRVDLAGGRLAQGQDLSAIAELIAELDDLGDTAEVLDQPDDAPEGLAGQIVDGRLAVVELLVRDPVQELVDEPLPAIELEADRVRADLLVIADDDHFPGQAERGQAEYVALARLVDDDDVERDRAELEALERA